MREATGIPQGIIIILSGGGGVGGVGVTITDMAVCLSVWEINRTERLLTSVLITSVDIWA